ncbi:hypothetical protein cgR_5059 [Corynebacterium glutamicum R]|uniref:Transposase n=1 Tax=Corynebacterium glutamicum (strain R) TaxID=340322 RepID=A0AB72VEZ9_CORGB|nr:hypothetical protein cgR_5059 [Corynebacterium glutamicum R]
MERWFGRSSAYLGPVRVAKKVKPDRRDKNLDFHQVLARLSGLGDWKPDTRAKTSAFSPILSRLSGLPRKG